MWGAQPSDARASCHRGPRLRPGFRPHRHRIGKWELLNLLQGRLDAVIFSPDGRVKHRFALRPDGPSLIEIPGGEWHSFVFHPPLRLSWR
jgi:cupin fold WbuC family metalloprotein